MAWERGPHNAPSGLFIVESTLIEGVHIVLRTARRDDRGEFSRVHCVSDFGELDVLSQGMVQTNLQSRIAKERFADFIYSKSPLEGTSS